MNLLSLSIVAVILAAQPAASTRPQERVPRPVALSVERFDLPEDAEVGLEIEARSPGASWAREGAEAAALRVEVDGEYNQGLLLWAGEQPFEYKVLLGRLPKGKHVVSVALDRARSAAGAQTAAVSRLKILPFGAARESTTGRTGEDALAVAHAPFIYARANSIDRFTDVPLVMYYETERGADGTIAVRYTVIFSHEDGGTPAAALMARWGRATDIEWVYEVILRGGRVVEERYQGVEHRTKNFTGRRASGAHPLLAVASDNNNFSDLACSAVRFAPLPVRADLAAGSRETLMDAHPWTYRVMAEELRRERRISDAPADASTIRDPRDYVYVEAYAEQQGATVSFDVIVHGDARPHSSDLGDARLRIERSGFFRSAVPVPAGTDPGSINEIIVRCHANDKPGAERVCRDIRVVRALVLGRSHVPRPLQVIGRNPATLKPGDSAAFKLARPD